jgi:hypothetical protein
MLAHVAVLVQCGVQGLELIPDTIRKIGEWGDGITAHRVEARAAGGGLTGALSGALNGALILVLTGALIGTVCALVFANGRWGCGGGDTSGQGNGSDESDDGFVEQHCKECSMKEVVVFSVC